MINLYRCYKWFKHGTGVNNADVLSLNISHFVPDVLAMQKEVIADACHACILSLVDLI